MSVKSDQIQVGHVKPGNAYSIMSYLTSIHKLPVNVLFGVSLIVITQFGVIANRVTVHHGHADKEDGEALFHGYKDATWSAFALID
ncbi:hypothetical protein PspLS_09776 [Pyricularia sp. CBS 133598]|nr:hypothetical protein PspLS_09776 [Pyricularia sp. CBS 133598]